MNQKYAKETAFSLHVDVSLPRTTYSIVEFPPEINLDTVPILKAAAVANRHLAELKGAAKSIPNQGILIDTLSLQEAKASSEIENIVTTHDELFRHTATPEDSMLGAAKEVALYRDALRLGFQSMRRDGHNIITNNMLIDMFRLLKRRDDGFRRQSGTELQNDVTGETVYVPPQSAGEIDALMANLEGFINQDELEELDPLIKMALIHHQFESIHPFPDGNGRIGRIINVLYLTKEGLRLCGMMVSGRSGFCTYCTELPRHRKRL
jgi:Fic family protein